MWKKLLTWATKNDILDELSLEDEFGKTTWKNFLKKVEKRCWQMSLKVVI